MSAERLEPSGRRGYSWPPFAAGHELSTRHGAWSPRKRAPIEVALTDWAMSAAPWLTDPLAGPSLAAWARAEAMVQLIATWLDTHDAIDHEGEVVGAVTTMARFEKVAMSLRQQLGLDPRSKLALLREQTAAVAEKVDLEAVMAAGQAALDARVTDTTAAPMSADHDAAKEHHRADS